MWKYYSVRENSTHAMPHKYNQPKALDPYKKENQPMNDSQDPKQSLYLSKLAD